MSSLKFKRRKSHSLVSLFFIVTMIFLLLFLFTFPALDLSSYVTTTINDYAHSIMNQAASNIPCDLFSDLTLISRDSSGAITGISANPAKVNALKNSYVDSLSTLLNDSKNTTLSIPLGNLTGSALLSGYGPLIKIRITPLGYVNASVESELSDSGINQTKHTIYINASVSLTSMYPFYKNTTAEIRLPVSETVIVGNVPSLYSK